MNSEHGFSRKSSYWHIRPGRRRLADLVPSISVDWLEYPDAGSKRFARPLGSYPRNHSVSVVVRQSVLDALAGALADCLLRRVSVVREPVILDLHPRARPSSA